MQQVRGQVQGSLGPAYTETTSVELRSHVSGKVLQDPKCLSIAIFNTHIFGDTKLRLVRSNVKL